nr:hypothetical protein BaRGS_004303 [Batillaria attramentaria]
MLEDDPDFEDADIFIEPPPVQEDTDEDSADEDEEGTISNLNRRQLQAPAIVTVRRHGEKQPYNMEESANIPISASNKSGISTGALTLPKIILWTCLPSAGVLSESTLPKVVMQDLVVQEDLCLLTSVSHESGTMLDQESDHVCILRVKCHVKWSVSCFGSNVDVSMMLYQE